MKTMPLPEIIKRLTALNHCSEQLSQAFITEFSNLVIQALNESGTISIKEIGTFRRIEILDDVTVEFAPDPSLAEAVNAPFAMFEPVELDDTVTEAMLDEAAAGNNSNASAEPCTEQPETLPVTDDNGHAVTESTEEHAEENASDIHHTGDADPSILHNNPQPEPQLPPGIPPVPPAETSQTYGNPQETSSATHETERQSSEVSPKPAPAHSATNATNATNPTPATEKDTPVAVTHEKIIEKERVVEVENRGRHTMHLIITALIALIAGLLIGLYSSDLLNISNVKSVNISADDVQVYHRSPAIDEPGEQMAETVDTVADTISVPELQADTATIRETTPQPAVIEAKTIVTDTVRSNRFLTTMAREYYGKKKFWVYIYEENRATLKDPDRIECNTVVVIPPAEKYGIKAGDKASEEDAERRAAEIMNGRQ